MVALILTLFSLVVLPQTKLEVESIPFLVLAALTCIFAANSRIRQTSSKAGMFIITFFVLCMVHVIFIFAEVMTTAEYVRGLIPFLFLGFFFITTRLTSVKNFKHLYFGIIAVGLVMGLGLDCLGFAIVRLIHFNVIFAIVIGMLEVLKRDYAFAAPRMPRFRVFVGAHPQVPVGRNPLAVKG